MKFIIKIDPSVFEELEEAVLYYEFQQFELGEKLFTDWENTLEVVSKHPSSFQKAIGNYRQISLKKFPYILIYELEDNTISIFRFICSRRDEIKRYK